jgi:DNA-binding NtrC family response regulator
MIKILLVDDEISILKMLKWRLETSGFLVNTALCGLEALEKVELNTPNVIVTDVRMPKMDGITLVKTLRESQSYYSLPCIMMSGHGDIDMAKEVYKIGASGYIHKPVKFEELLQLIQKNTRD